MSSSLLSQMNDIFTHKTSDGFHDCSLEEFTVSVTDIRIKLVVIHVRRENENDIYLKSDIIFNDFDALKIKHVDELWGKSFYDSDHPGTSDELSGIDAYEKDGTTIIEIVGIYGWVITFTAQSVIYTEEVLDIDTYWGDQ